MLTYPKQKNCSNLIREKLDEGILIQPFPAVVSQLLSAFQDPTADAKTFARIIETDAGLAARLLRMANSPIYGFSNVIRTIDHAVTILGIVPLRNIALAFAGASVFSKSSDSDPRESLWDHSLGCATTARLLANSVSTVNDDEAFLAGIFHDVGKLLFYNAVPKQYASITDANSGRALTEMEAEQFGLTHEEVGAKLTSNWQLPESIRVVVGNHHRPESAIAHQDLTALVHIADGLARAGGIGSPAVPSTKVLDAANQYFGLNERDLESVQEQAAHMYDETRAEFSNP